jgi:transposase-like protein
MINVMVKPTEVSSKARRRRFTTAEKIRILREADACAHETGGVTALLRREGLYSSHLTSWRRQRDVTRPRAATTPCSTCSSTPVSSTAVIPSTTSPRCSPASTHRRLPGARHHRVAASPLATAGRFRARHDALSRATPQFLDGDVDGLDSYGDTACGSAPTPRGCWRVGRGCWCCPTRTSGCSSSRSRRSAERGARRRQACRRAGSCA